ncbi:hypothetical protein BY458DRAFT_487861 [Sporodiniella umbellata]|nr:hypothetical protein BY458DRAFT_487861 [Sporodiniella umbellata]
MQIPNFRIPLKYLISRNKASRKPLDKVIFSKLLYVSSDESPQELLFSKRLVFLLSLSLCNDSVLKFFYCYHCPQCLLHYSVTAFHLGYSICLNIFLLNQKVLI